MQRWWRWRDDDAYEMYWFASLMGQPGASSALTTRLLRDVSVDADATRSLLRVLNHDLRPSELFTPPMLARATARAIRDEPSHIPEKVLRAGLGISAIVVAALYTAQALAYWSRRLIIAKLSGAVAASKPLFPPLKVDCTGHFFGGESSGWGAARLEDDW